MLQLKSMVNIYKSVKDKLWTRLNFGSLVCFEGLEYESLSKELILIHVMGCINCKQRKILNVVIEPALLPKASLAVVP